ncbi:MAG: hypothetical protein JNN20_10715 [Betaproteobacteria bacterium]|nr:hypothetical protein [Betaproteobacteria bacterium]
MAPSESISVFSSFAKANGVNISGCTPREGLEQMFLFYQSVAPKGCDQPNGDMLLFQWGTYDWGAGKHFELNITRQFIEQAFDDDDAISQLSLTFKFAPTLDLVSIGDGNRWCDGPTEFELVRGFAFSSSAFIVVADHNAHVVELTHCYV